MKTMRILVFVILGFALMINPTFAAIRVSGDTLPLSADTLWWNNGGDGSTAAMIGCNGVGHLTVDVGSDLKSSNGFIGLQTDAYGTVSIDDVGSTWTINNDLTVGMLGSGALTLTNGATVSVAHDVTVNSTSEMALLLNGPSPMITAGGSLTNDGTIRMFVDNWAEPGTFTPISVAGDWTNNGNIEAYGGVWNEATRTLEVPEAMEVALNYDGSISTFDMDLIQAPRIKFLDSETQVQAGISFPQGSGAHSVTVSYAILASADTMEVDFFMAWEFVGVPQGQEALLSFEIGTHYDVEKIAIEHNETIIEPEFLHYSDGWLSFAGDVSGEYCIGYYRPAMPRMPGDANGDGKVDGSDVTIVADNWQAGVGNPNPTTITWQMGDFNHDGQVDGSDVTILADRWQAGVSTTAVVVPEPSTIVLLLTALIGLAVWRRR